MNRAIRDLARRRSSPSAGHHPSTVTQASADADLLFISKSGRRRRSERKKRVRASAAGATSGAAPYASAARSAADHVAGAQRQPARVGCSRGWVRSAAPGPLSESCSHFGHAVKPIPGVGRVTQPPDPGYGTAARQGVMGGRPVPRSAADVAAGEIQHSIQQSIQHSGALDVTGRTDVRTNQQLRPCSDTRRDGLVATHNPLVAGSIPAWPTLLSWDDVVMVTSLSRCAFGGLLRASDRF